MNEGHKETVIYEQKCQDIRALNEILWRVPILVITITGGLWFGAASLEISSQARFFIFILASLVNFVFIFILWRLRFIINLLLKDTKKFEGIELSRGYVFVSLFAVILFVSSGFSLDAALQDDKYLKEVAMTGECLFCTSDFKARILFEQGTVFAVEDKFPVTDGHMLIIPKRHATDYFSMTGEEKRDAEALILKMKNKILDKDPLVKGFNIGLNCGEAAGQTVPHAHIHLIPRRKGDLDDPRGGVRGVIPDKRIYTPDSELSNSNT